MGRSTVGVRELRQNLSVYLRRVRQGEALEVMEHGQLVAMLIPVPEPSTPLNRLIALGRASTPDGDLLDLGRPEGKPTRELSDALSDASDERL
ncbi:MAG: type II toxin-antitoxin system prevent-host-death family antitoxin [Acidobacteria bacterium]|nr:MAG: type II toxin-antitoxin system prevent-host-death family antitoxin [Acidobacteriota bacterium]